MNRDPHRPPVTDFAPERMIDWAAEGARDVLSEEPPERHVEIAPEFDHERYALTVYVVVAFGIAVLLAWWAI